MKKKFLGRVLTMLLVASMVFTLLPAPAIAAGNWWWNNEAYTEEAVPTATTTADANYHYNIFFLDCGRKYYSVDSIKQLINNASEAGFNYIQLAVGNDGLRLLLDDMSLTVGTTTYVDKDVRDAIHAGNEKYYNFPVDELTESEMNGIIAYANTKGMGVIPCVNTPGHMDAILSAATSLTKTNCSYSGSKRTIDVTNETATAFTKALLQKYITYFKSQGCQLFNMGADEYANDKFTGGSMGFGNLQTSGNYGKYVEYVNQVAAMIKNAGMKPMAFNDGIYFNNNTYSGTFDTDIIICYWSSGWSSYSPMPAATLADKGFKLVNTHGDYYWVLGGTQCDANKASGFNCKSFPGSTINSPAGSMFCIWADSPGVLTEQQVIDQTAATIAAFGKALPAATPDTTTPTPPETGTTPPETGTTEKTITVSVNGTATDTIEGANYAGLYTTDKPDVATVTVTGQDGTPESATYTRKEVEISTIAVSGVWEKSQNNYYKDGENYYPVYCKRETVYFFGNPWGYIYYYGYSKTDSSSDVEKLGQTGYGSTKVTVYVKDTVPGIPASTTVTFNGLAEGTTYVTIGNTKYKIEVVPEDVNNVTPLSIEYWITNSKVLDETTNNTGRTISAAEVYGEGGKAIAELVPQNAVKQSDKNAKMLFWKATRLTKGNYQAAENGNDKTMAGDDFSYIRYWNLQWEFSANGTNWTPFNGDDQVVAYYMQLTKVTDEVTTTVVDWGEPKENLSKLNYLGGQFVLLDFAVKYESGDRLPSAFPTENTIGFHCDKMAKRTLGRINAIPSNEYEVYMITLTPSNDDASVVLSASSAQNAASKEYTYAGTEKVVWVDKEEDLGQFTDKSLQHGDFTVGGEATLAKGVTINKGQGMLVTYYLRTKVTEDFLTVNYVDLGNTSEPFYSYKIAVRSGTTFKSDIQLADPAEQDLLNGDVVNIKGKTQTVTADLTKMPGVPAQYRYSKYQCKNLVKNDGKTITLYYTFNNSVGFVVDFGLPLMIKAKDLSNAFGDGSQIQKQDVTKKPKHGTAVFDGINIIYTPGNTFPSSSGDSFTVTYTGKNPKDGKEGSASFVINILPASNVLYEENFLTEAPASNGLSWKQGTPAELGSQETQKAKADGNVFGYDDAYVPSDTKPVTGELGVWKATDLEVNKRTTSALTTDFYGNGFDLIGNCGPSTGRVILFVKNAETGKGKLIDVDTRYSGGDLYQVPLAHVMMDKEASYNVTIYAAGLKATNETPASYNLSGAATYASDYAVGGYDTVLSDILAENGLTMADVEYVKVESAPAATTRSAASFYALDTAAETGTITHAAGKHVEIDGFRVYRSSTNNTNYPKSEQDVQYLNILDAVSNFTAFVEGSTADSKWEARDKYENAGGPQNEIYLRKTDGENSAIAFKIDPNAIVQISARAVENEKAAELVVNGVKTVIATNTEMYYTFAASENGIVTIKNTGKGMLALGNLKIKKGTQAAALSEEDYPAAIALLSLNAAPETPDEGFNPAINAKVTTTRFIRSKVVTLMVSASADVEKLMVNGVELRPTNSWLVKMGWSDTYTYILTEKVQKSETKTYEIVGYRADGAASETIVVKSK